MVGSIALLSHLLLIIHEYIFFRRTTWRLPKFLVTVRHLNEIGVSNATPSLTNAHLDTDLKLVARLVLNCVWSGWFDGILCR